jgi:hypothetical protein
MLGFCLVCKNGSDHLFQSVVKNDVSLDTQFTHMGKDEYLLLCSD